MSPKANRFADLFLRFLIISLIPNLVLGFSFLLTMITEILKLLVYQIVQVYRELYTHFISFPLAIHPELKEKVETFRNSILGDNKDKKPLKFQSSLDGKIKQNQSKQINNVAFNIIFFS